jgi:hypothetical protein
MVESSGTLRDADLREADLRPYARISRLAVLSLVLALLGCLVVPIPVAIVCAILAIRRIRASKGALAGMPLAVGAIGVAVAVALAWGGYTQWRASKHRRGEEQSTRAVGEFFDWLSRGYLEDAYALLSTDGKMLYRDQLPGFRKFLEPQGKFQDVRLVESAWPASAVGKMKFAVRFQNRELTYVITVAEEEGKWRLAGFELKSPR